MKGVVFNLLEAVVERRFGPDAWDELLAGAGLDGAYASIASYDDAEFAVLLAGMEARLGLSRGAALRWFGESAMPLLKERYPALFAPHNSSRGFVLSVNNVIHPEVRKTYAGAACPMFGFREEADGTVCVAYGSSRRMCDLAEGFVRGAASLFCEEVEVTHKSCMNHGAEKCLMELRWVN